jgi:peptide/nickel transport system substrate-binding protein
VKRWASMLAVLALVAVACGSSSATGQRAGPKSGGTLTVALDGDMKYADPSFVNDSSSLYVADQVVEGLVGLEPGTISTVIPVLASALPTVSPDGLTITFKLRSGIKFHDGTDFNAAAVKFNYDRWKNLPAGDLQNGASNYEAVFGGFLVNSNLASVDAPDPSTVVFSLVKPQSNFLISQTVASFGVQSPAAIKANDGNNPKLSKNAYALGSNGQGKAMVGTGPFMFSERKANDHITLVKNPNYWNPVAGPYLDRIVFKPFADSASELAALQSGAVDLVETLDPAAVKTLRGKSNMVVLDRGTGCNITQLGMNALPVPNAPANVLASKNLRFAIAAAVNRAAYINGYYAGEATVADNWLPAGADYYKREYLPAYNVTAAMGYMAQAGHSTGGVSVDLWYPTGAPASVMPDPKGLAEAIALDLQAVGITTRLRSEAYSPNYLADEAAGKLPMWLQSQSCKWGGADDFLYSSFFHYTNDLASPTYNYTNDPLNTVMLQALSDTDSAKAKTDWYKAQDLIAADMPTVPLFSAKLPAGAHKYVMGFVGAGNRTEVLSTVWLNK